MKKVKPAPSASFLIGRVPTAYTEADIKELFKEFQPIESIKFHYVTQNLFTNKVTVTFSSLELANRAAQRLLGKHVGKDNLLVQYSLIPNNMCKTLAVGGYPYNEMKDDVDIPGTSYAPGNFICEWNDLSEIHSTLIPANITYVGLRFNSLRTFGISLPNLTELNLKGNDIEIFPSNVSLPNLKKLNISHNLLKEFPDLTIFSPLVEHIDATTNHLLEVHSSVSKLSKLVYLDISHNSITTIPDLPESLRHLLAHSNKIVSSTVTKPIKLRELSLWKNRIEEVPHFSYGAIDQVTICHNKLTYFPVECLTDCIVELNICMNCLTSIPPALFKIKNLRSLILFGNCIKEVPPEFSESYLETFDISENLEISNLPMIPFQLRTLKLNFCNFTDLNHCVPKLNSLLKLHAIANHLTSLPVLPNIEEILVPGNELTEFPNIECSFMQQMVIDVSHNKISRVPELTAPFRLLDLSYNLITELPISYFSTRSYIYLTGNPITATFNTSQMKRLCALDVSNTNVTIEEEGEIHDNLFEIVMDAKPDKRATDIVRVYFETDQFVSHAGMIGTRSAMEDCVVVRHNLRPDVSVYGLFDGHGGSRVSRFAAIGFPDLISDLDIIDGPAMTKICEDYYQTIISTNETAGATMDLVVLQKNHVLISHIGDGKVVIFGEDGTIRFQTHAQNAFMREELERLRKDKIKLRRMRTAGTLAMSRAIGDILIRGVSHVPQNIEYDIEDGRDRWLIIACDGIVDDLDLPSMGKTIVRTGSAELGAQFLRDQAYSRGSEDNISVIVVDLKPIFEAK